MSLPAERLSERQTRRAAPVPKRSLSAQAGSPFSPGGRRVPPVPFLGPPSARSCGPGLCVRSGQPARFPRPLRASHASRRAAVVHCSCIACSGGTHAVFPQCITEARPLLDRLPTQALAEGAAASGAWSRQEKGAVHAAGRTTSSAHGGRGPGFAPERKSVPEGQTLSPSLAFGPRWLSWHVWPEVASGPGQRASPAGQAVYRTGRDQSLRGGRISLVPSPASLLSCLSSRGNQSQPDLGNGREAVRTVGATLLGDRSV